MLVLLLSINNFIFLRNIGNRENIQDFTQEYLKMFNHHLHFVLVINY